MQQGNSAVATISIALNAVHQSGSMLDYVGARTGESIDDIKKILDNMTSGTNIPKWNEDLKKVGVQMDSTNQWLQQPKSKPEQAIQNPNKNIEVPEPNSWQKFLEKNSFSKDQSF
jgi:hypothetical protein